MLGVAVELALAGNLEDPAKGCRTRTLDSQLSNGIGDYIESDGAGDMSTTVGPRSGPNSVRTASPDRFRELRCEQSVEG